MSTSIKEEKFTFGIVIPWPGAESAETELLYRMKKASQDADINCILLDNLGHVLNDDQEVTEEYVDDNVLDCIISTHYDTYKCRDTFYYFTIWNPPDIPLIVGDYASRITANYLMNDDYLIYGQGGMVEHLKSILINKPRNIDNATMLCGSFPQSSMLEPKLDNPLMFYCGMNWEKVICNSNRHEGLFKLLDSTNAVKFFGPDLIESWGNIRPWEGYKCYQREIPFDGFSILKEINECGVCLVLSSDIHRRANAVTNRAYEACAAGAVMISDDNEFMKEHFGDAALFINYNKNDPQDTFNQIMEKYNWILDNKEEALNLAKRAQKVFAEKFALDRQLKVLAQQHQTRMNVVAGDLYAKNNDKNVLVVYVCNQLDVDIASKHIKLVINNFTKQIYENKTLIVVVDNQIINQIEAPLKEYCVATEIFDFKQSKKNTDATILYDLLSHHTCDCFVITGINEIWFKDHITTLVRSLSDEKAMFAYSGLTVQNRSNGQRFTSFFETYSSEQIHDCFMPYGAIVSGQCMFDVSAWKYFDKCYAYCIDGMETHLLMNILIFKHDSKGVFSRRMTLVYEYDLDLEKAIIMTKAMQKKFIQDIVKYDVQKFGITMTTTMSSSKVDGGIALANAPIKLLASIRFYRLLLRFFDEEGMIGKKIYRRYARVSDKYRDFWNAQ